jgi:hypothetical protein
MSIVSFCRGQDRPPLPFRKTQLTVHAGVLASSSVAWARGRAIRCFVGLTEYPVMANRRRWQARGVSCITRINFEVHLNKLEVLGWHQIDE